MLANHLFFFQAEDGIRDFCLSRGLGDVYKRQLLVMALKGVPAFYLPALLASENDIKRFSMTGQRRDLNREKFKSENLLAVLNNPESNANKNLKYLRNAMDVRSKLKQFHPCSQMKCLSKDRSDIVVIKRSKGPESVFAIHNMTCLLYTSPSPRDRQKSRMPSSA